MSGQRGIIMRRFILALVLGGFICSANAALVDRGGGLIYDSDQNITWLQDALYAQTNGDDPDGGMDWADAVAWANVAMHRYRAWCFSAKIAEDGTSTDKEVQQDG